MTKERIEKELLKVREQLAGLQARQKDLEEQLQMAEDAEKMKFIWIHLIRNNNNPYIKTR